MAAEIKELAAARSLKARPVASSGARDATSGQAKPKLVDASVEGRFARCPADQGDVQSQCRAREATQELQAWIQSGAANAIAKAKQTAVQH